MKSTLKLLPLALILGACSFIPEYQRPDVALPKSWEELALAEQAQEMREGKSVAELGWRDYFQDPLLQKLIEEALEYNHDLRTAILNLEVARAQYRIQRSEQLPTVSGSGSFSRSRTAADLSSTGEPVIGESYSVNLGVSAFELDFFGRVRALSESALNTYLATAEARDSVQLSVISSVAQTYYQARISLELMRLSEEVLQTRLESLRLSQLQYDAGIMTAISLHTTREAVESARASYASAKRSYQQALNALSLLIGRPINQVELPPSEALTRQFAKMQLPTGIVSEVLQNRPDIRQAEYELRAANADIGAARAALFPSISLTSSVGYGSTELDRLIERPNLAWTITPSISLPIFNRASLNRNVEISEAQQKIALESYQSAVQTAFYEVADALVARETLHEQYAAQERGNKAVSERLRLENLRFQAGVSSALDLLDAQRESFSSEQELLNTELLMLNNNVELYIALGGGLLERARPVEQEEVRVVTEVQIVPPKDNPLSGLL